MRETGDPSWTAAGVGLDITEVAPECQKKNRKILDASENRTKTGVFGLWISDPRA
jgi:hypothetical protein